MDLHIYRAAAEYTFFSSTHGTFSRIGHMVGHKTSFSKLKKKKKSILSVFANHSEIKRDQ
jgi:hypothetical protein